MALKTTIKILSEEEKKAHRSEFGDLIKKAVSEAVARQKALGLPNYYVKNGKVYGRAPNGRFVKTKR